jgi:hypothetical protein
MLVPLERKIGRFSFAIYLHMRLVSSEFLLHKHGFSRAIEVLFLKRAVSRARKVVRE